MRGKGFHKESSKEAKAISSENFVIPKKTIYALLFVTVVLTSFITYLVVILTQTPKVVTIREGFPVSESGGEVSLFIKPKQLITSEGEVSLSIASQGG